MSKIFVLEGSGELRIKDCDDLEVYVKGDTWKIDLSVKDEAKEENVKKESPNINKVTLKA